MKHEIVISFPCGYTYKSYLETGMFEFVKAKVEVDDQQLPICPLHRENCPNSEKESPQETEDLY